MPTSPDCRKLSGSIQLAAETANEQASIDSLDVLEEVMKFFLRRAIEASDEKGAKRFARDADRALKTLALYHPFYYRVLRTKR